jgi:hypothetical protein
MQLLILAALGVMGGVLSGVVDGGGGIIFVPALVYAAGWDIKEALAASLVVVIGASLPGTLRNLKSEDPINWRVAALLSSTAAPASDRGFHARCLVRGPPARARPAARDPIRVRDLHGPRCRAYLGRRGSIAPRRLSSCRRVS